MQTHIGTPTIYIIPSLFNLEPLITDNKSEVIKLFTGKEYEVKYSFPIIDTETLKEVVNYKFPIVNDNLLPNSNSSINPYKPGVLMVDKNSIYYTPKQSITKEFLEEYIKAIFYDRFSDTLYLSPIELNDDYIDNTDYQISLSDETKQKMKDIAKEITKLKDNGGYVHILSILEKFISEEKKETDISYLLSKIYVTEFRDIILPDFNNFEVKLGTLTKCVYLLFIKYKSISLNDLHYYRDELISFYTRLSNRVDYDKMRASINKIISDKNEVYVHLSRIKSFFYNNFDEVIADWYIISGNKNEPKKIKLSDEMIIWNF